MSGVIALTSSVGALMDAANFFRLADSITDIPEVHRCIIDGCDAVGLDNIPAMYDLLDSITKVSACSNLCFIREVGEYSDSAQREQAQHEQAFFRYLSENDLPLNPERL